MTSEDYNTKILEEYKNGLATEEEMSSLLMIFAMQYHKERLRQGAVVKSLPQDNFCDACNLPTDGKKCYSKRCPV